MRDQLLLAFTLLAIRQLGGDHARLVQDGRPCPSWYAGPQTLNAQSVRDLLNDGWLRPVEGESGQIRIDTWPRLATRNSKAQRGRDLTLLSVPPSRRDAVSIVRDRRSPMNDETYAAYEAKLARARQLKAEIMPHNKQVLFEALNTAGIALVSVAFDGVGDSRQIEGVEAFGPDNTSLSLPSSPIAVRAIDLQAGCVVEKEVSVTDYLEELAYDLLGSTHSGWEADASKMILADFRHRALRLSRRGVLRRGGRVRSHHRQLCAPDRAGSADRRAAHHRGSRPDTVLCGLSAQHPARTLDGSHRDQARRERSSDPAPRLSAGSSWSLPNTTARKTS